MNQAARKIQDQRTTNRAIIIIQLVPFSRSVSLTGSRAEGRETENSDIDFFIQIAPGRLFSTRFFITLFLSLAGLRRTDQTVAGKVCLNWFATYDAPAKQQQRAYRLLWKDSASTLTSERKGRGLTLKPFFEFLLSGFLGNYIEKILKYYQIARIERDPRTHVPGSQVRYSDTELGFHPPKT